MLKVFNLLLTCFNYIFLTVVLFIVIGQLGVVIHCFYLDCISRLFVYFI